MTNNNSTKKSQLITTSTLGVTILLLIVIVFLSWNRPWAGNFSMQHDVNNMSEHHSQHYMMMSMDDKREGLIEMKQSIIGELIAQGDYACCLEKPCTYCIEKTPGHGEGATCHCLDDVVNGVHPCGECIGEIMEGHGNKFLAKYFAQAIAEKVGEQHHASLQLMMQDMYGMAVAEQI